MSQPQIQQLHSSPRRRVLPNVVNSNPIDLPSALLNNNSIINRSIGFRVRRFIGSSSSRHNWSLVLHGFPLLVLLCFFLLWWFSSPVNLAIKDGRIIQSFSVQKAVSLNDTEFNLSRMTILAVAASPNSNIQTSAQFILSVIENVGDPSAEGSNR
ncbi:hypothetical protein BVRB_7g175430 [Beta vulgaris subsp. vulgaris]|nr:hypothetical protein BVRB_7g175430 [Beta vulgaris subsp. vulgaris]